VQNDALLSEAHRLALRVAANPPHIVRMTKRLLRAAHNSNLPAVLEASAAMQAIAHTTKDHQEAVAAFLAKRPPAFKGE